MELFTSISGSQLYGLATETSDYDYITVEVESPAEVFSGHAPKARQSGSSDTRTMAGESETTVYTLRHFVQLARAGNPNVLPVLFNPNLPDCFPDNIMRETIGTYMYHNRNMFLSKQCVHRFKGYMMSQRDRLTGNKKKHVPNRPELIEQYGYDVKFAMHACRMGIMGVQLHEEGTLSVPMKENDRRFLLDVRNGEYREDFVFEFVETCIKNLDVPRNVLPNKPDDAKIDGLLYRIHHLAWAREGYGSQVYV